MVIYLFQISIFHTIMSLSIRFNRGVSIIHASTVFILACWYWRVLNPSLIVNGHLTISEFQAFTLDVMMGYLWYDIIIELSTTRQADTIGHHVLGLISHLSCRITNNEAGAFYRFYRTSH